jgi:hypothetical protein
MPSSGKRLVKLPESAVIPFFGEMDNQPSFGGLALGWNENGLGVEFTVQGKSKPIYGEAGKPTACDGLVLWIDTRDSRTIHRANRFCTRIFLLAHDGSPEAAAGVRTQPIKRAAEEPPTMDLSAVRIVRYALDDSGDEKPTAAGRSIKNYGIEAFIPASVLHGFDPESNRRLGFFYRIRDNEFGDQILTGARELPYWEDPSLWSVLTLDK